MILVNFFSSLTDLLIEVLTWSGNIILRVMFLYMDIARDIAQAIAPEAYVNVIAAVIFVVMMFITCIKLIRVFLGVAKYTVGVLQLVARIILSLVIVAVKGWSFRRAWNALGYDIGQQCIPGTTMDFPNVSGEQEDSEDSYDE